VTPAAAKKESFKRLDETCPTLDRILADLGDTISNNFRFDESDDILLQDEIKEVAARIRKEVSEPLRKLSIEAFCLADC
jgi:hypothetical protein